MENNLTCEVCSVEFDGTQAIPKVLKCGHSFCSPCITKIINENPYCPKCRQFIHDRESSLPTNYSILGVVDSFKTMRNLEQHVVCSMDMLKTKYLQRKILLSKKNEINSSLEVIEDGLTSLQEWTGNDKEIDTRKTKKLCVRLEEDFKKTEDFVHFNYWKLRLSVSIPFRSFETPEKYLTEIYKKLQNEENIFAVHQIEDRRKFGKVTVYNNKLIFHSLTLSEVPKYSSLIWFNDLKQCLTSKNFFTVIKISCNEKGVTHMAIIELFDRHACNQFIKLCTGECGPSYKGSSYTKGDVDVEANKSRYYEPVLCVEKFIENECEIKRSLEYLYCGDKVQHNFNFSCGDMLLYLNSDGGFHIYRCTNSSDISEPPFGRVVSPTKLYELIDYKYPSYLKVIDCGIVFDV